VDDPTPDLISALQLRSKCLQRCQIINYFGQIALQKARSDVVFALRVHSPQETHTYLLFANFWQYFPEGHWLCFVQLISLIEAVVAVFAVVVAEVVKIVVVVKLVVVVILVVVVAVMLLVELVVVEPVKDVVDVAVVVAVGVTVVVIEVVEEDVVVVVVTITLPFVMTYRQSTG